jgi:hypothetical protein
VAQALLFNLSFEGPVRFAYGAPFEDDKNRKDIAMKLVSLNVAVPRT